MAASCKPGTKIKVPLRKGIDTQRSSTRSVHGNCFGCSLEGSAASAGCLRRRLTERDGCRMSWGRGSSREGLPKFWKASIRGNVKMRAMIEDGGKEEEEEEEEEKEEEEDISVCAHPFSSSSSSSPPPPSLVNTAASVSGEEDTIAGFPAYTVTPTTSHARAADRNKFAVVLLPDAPGYTERGIRNLADRIGDLGYFTVCPHLHRQGSWDGPDIRRLSMLGGRGVAEDDMHIRAYDEWCVEEWIDEHSSFQRDLYNVVRFLKRKRNFERVAVVGCGWGGRQALLASYFDGPVPVRYKRFLQFHYFAAAAGDVVDGALWTQPLVDAAVALSPYTVKKVDVILGRVPSLVVYGDEDRVSVRGNRNLVRDWCKEKPPLEHSLQFEQAKFQTSFGAGYGFMWRAPVRGNVGKVQFSGSGGGGRSGYSFESQAKRKSFEALTSWLNAYLDCNDVEYLPPWMSVMGRNWLDKGSSKVQEYNAQYSQQKLDAVGWQRKEMAFSGVDRDEDVDWDFGWENVPHVNDFEKPPKWDTMK